MQYKYLTYLEYSNLPADLILDKSKLSRSVCVKSLPRASGLFEAASSTISQQEK
jgi:hypothetical protein